MDGQITLMDWCGNEALEGISEAEAVKMIGDALNIQFKYRDDFWGWEYKKGEVICQIKYDNYIFNDNHRQFIGVDINWHQSGWSSPCDNIDEAIEMIKKAFEKIKKEKENKHAREINQGEVV